MENIAGESTTSDTTSSQNAEAPSLALDAIPSTMEYVTPKTINRGTDSPSLSLFAFFEKRVGDEHARTGRNAFKREKRSGKLIFGIGCVVIVIMTALFVKLVVPEETCEYF